MKQSLPLILIALAILTFFVFIDPQNKEVQLLIKQKQDNDTMLGLAQDLQAKRKTLDTAYKAISPEAKQRLTRLLPDTVDNVRLVSAINSVAAQRGLLIRDIGVTREGESRDTAPKNTMTSIETSGETGTITLSFSVTAPYDKFISFLKDLEQALRIVDVRALEVSPNTASAARTPNALYTFAITLDTYWLR
jgi:Tfp pilus assembly protein PilO